jgi:hypothetical protein
VYLGEIDRLRTDLEEERDGDVRISLYDFPAGTSHSTLNDVEIGNISNGIDLVLDGVSRALP